VTLHSILAEALLCIEGAMGQLQFIGQRILVVNDALC
jgi:hypothetical protein